MKCEKEKTGSTLFEDEDPVDGSIEQPTLSEFLSVNRQEGKLLISHLTLR
jgi:hypothetical protein